MEIRQLRYFLDIADTEHLTQSAQNLFVTQSTLSHGLRQLEQELGVALFDRLGRGLKLSQAGAEFRVYASRALQEIEAGRMALADLGGLQSGKLKVGAFPTFLNTVVPVTVAAFNRAYPKVKVEVQDLRAGAIEQQLLDGDLDLGIAFHPAQHDAVALGRLVVLLLLRLRALPGGLVRDHGGLQCSDRSRYLRRRDDALRGVFLADDLEHLQAVVVQHDDVGCSLGFELVKHGVSPGVSQTSIVRRAGSRPRVFPSFAFFV